MVIDLPNTMLAQRQKRIPVRSGGIKEIRAVQHASSVRVVVDLQRASNYTSELKGNRITVHVYPAHGGMIESAVTNQAPIPVTPSPTSSTDDGVFLAGSRLSAGSSITAGADPAILRLGRGGEVRVCPGTTLSVTPAQNGRDLMLGMSTGALEAHYALQASADSVLTPDFRILLAGPGEFHYAISADARGNTCVRALSGNTASVIVSELIGEATYQVKPAEQVLFHFGRLNAADNVIPAGCGCPEGPILSAVAAIAAASSMPPPPRPVAPPVPASEVEPLPAYNANGVHVIVDAPFVFRASDAAPPSPTSREIQSLSAASRVTPWPGTVLPPLPPPALVGGEQTTVRRGVFHKIKHFFSVIFR